MPEDSPAKPTTMETDGRRYVLSEPIRGEFSFIFEWNPAGTTSKVLKKCGTVNVLRYQKSQFTNRLRVRR